MKSLKESLGFSKHELSIDGMPKSSAGIILDQRDEKLNLLWMEIMKAEESFLKLSSETSKCCSALKEIQLIEEKLLKVLADSNISHYSYYIQEVLDEYTSAVAAIKLHSDDSFFITNEIMGVSPHQYQLLYGHLNSFKKKRDFLITEIQKCQDKYDKLKLKGKRTTDVSVEKERHLRQLKEVQVKLLEEAEKFHSLRIGILECCLRASVCNQINYYSGLTAEYGKHIHVSRSANQVKESDYLREVNLHLDEIKKLTIVDS